jgi:nucleotide-binding universal stress UspA family protein
VTSMTEPRIELPAPTERAERVVLAADDSYGAVAAAGWLADRARRRSMEIEIVVVERHVRSGQKSGPPEEIAEGVAWRMREYLAARIPSAATTIRIMQGEVVTALRDSAEDGDLLVLGCNRTGVWQHLALASRSTQVAEQAIRPTVLVPAGWTQKAGAVVVGIPGHEVPTLLEWGAAEAKSAGRPLLLLRSSALSWSIDTPVPEADVTLMNALDRRLLTDAGALIRLAHPGLEVRTELEHDGLARELTEHGAQAAMLVVGGPSGPGFGSALRRVLEHAPCPIAVVPGDRH